MTTWGVKAHVESPRLDLQSRDDGEAYSIRDPHHIGREPGVPTVPFLRHDVYNCARRGQPGRAVEYDLHNWSPVDILNALTELKQQQIPYVWDDEAQVLGVSAGDEAAASKVVLGDE